MVESTRDDRCSPAIPAMLVVIQIASVGKDFRACFKDWRVASGCARKRRRQMQRERERATHTQTNRARDGVEVRAGTESGRSRSGTRGRRAKPGAGAQAPNTCLRSMAASLLRRMRSTLRQRPPVLSAPVSGSHRKGTRQGAASRGFCFRV